MIPRWKVIAVALCAEASVLTNFFGGCQESVYLQWQASRDGGVGRIEKYPDASCEPCVRGCMAIGQDRLATTPGGYPTLGDSWLDGIESCIEACPGQAKAKR